MNTEENRRSRLIVVLRIVLPFIIVLVGVLAAKRLYDTRPKPERRAPMRVDPMVEVMQVRRATHTPVVRAYGEVTAARQIDLQALVAGEIVAVHPAFREGGIVPAGETVVTIDPRDYTVAVARAEAALSRARLALAVEEGAGEVARRERQLLGDAAELSPSEEALVRREPHRDVALKTLAAAEADLAQSRLNLERTRVTAPFTALIQSRAVDLGAVASAQKSIARIVDAETCWVRVSVPMDHVRPVLVAGTGHDGAVEVVAMDGTACKGTLIGDTGAVETLGRMAVLLVAIPGPGAAGPSATPMLGDYVEARLPATTLAEAIRLPQSALRNDDRVWLADAGSRLEIRPVTVAWRDHDYVYVSAGLDEGERVITTALTSVVAGTPLRIAGSDRHE
jgi:RND family efflux transporter MFP subunit